MDGLPSAHESDAGVSYRTEPPNVAAQSLKRRLGEAASAALMPIIKQAARPYLGGEGIEDALCVAARLRQEGFSTAFSYWDSGNEPAEAVEEIAYSTLSAIADLPRTYLSLKPPALRFSNESALRLARVAAQHGARLHFDSHGVETTDRQLAMIETMLGAISSEHLGITLPGRHIRSLRDADWAVKTGVNVRIVKGEWPDPLCPKNDLREGVLLLAKSLAGRARHVAIATHDLSLAQKAIAHLRAAQTSCEIEVLLGMPARPLLAWAKQNEVRVRVYIPYGCGFIPNAIGILRRNPRMALRIFAAFAKSCICN
jgi:proline dehydrogenase